MRRRVFIAIFGSALLGGTAILWRGLSSFWRPGSNEHTAETIKALTDLMFPGDRLPGAAALGIHNRIVAMPDLRDMLADGVGWLDRQAKSHGAADFLSLDDNTRSAAVEAAFASDDQTAREFVDTVRFYGGLNYYSKPAIKAVFSYTDPPQPEGFADFQDPPR
jgi:hypothetical protein